MGEKTDGWKRFIRTERYARKFFRQSLIMFLLVTSIPGLFTGLIIYWASTSQIERELQALHEKQIMQRAENIDDQLSYLELMFSQWSFDAEFDDRLKYLDFVYDYEKVHAIYRKLLVMTGSHPLIDRVELYLNSPRPLVFTKDIYTFVDERAGAERHAGLLQHKQLEFWHGSWRNDSRSQKGSDEPALSLVNKVPRGSTEPFGYIVALVNKERLVNLLQTLTPYNEGSTFLLSEDGEPIVSSSGTVSSELDHALLEAYVRQGGEAASFLLDYKQTTYSVSAGHFSRLGHEWTYVSAAPLTAITAPVLLISKLIVWISASGLALALIMSWLASNRLYRPVARLVGLLSKEREPLDAADNRDEFELIQRNWQEVTSERQLLSNRLEEHLPFMREGFLLQLVQGYLYSLTEKEIRDRLRHYGWDTDGLQFSVVLVQLHGFSNLEGRFSVGDEDLVTFASANIVAELTEQHLSRFQVLNFHDLSFGLLIAIPERESGSEFRAELRQLCAEWFYAVARVLKMQMTVSISGTTEQARHIPFLFDETRQALNYSDLKGSSQIIDPERLSDSEAMHKFSYPFALEKEIIHAVRIGSEEQAGALIERFLDTLTAGGPAKLVVQQGMMQLLASLQHAMLHSGTNPLQLFAGMNLFEQLSGIHDPSDMKTWFRQKVIGPYVRELISRQDHHLKQMVEKTIILLNENYTSVDLSLEACADQFGTSAYTLSRAFKQITGVNFIDYLTNLRIEKAKELLRETAMKISDVASKVSYQHTYFNRIFKKYEGVTPSQYREMSRARS
ncbi:AraC family transcriptional regulator [Paenibacillus xerothermodurans]|uniref:AraC family transcriptional regulator n=1 Tax=Paenibacillus xerothermodurans TaxID=1977292 RepID=A0A2W1NG16_PAEXE|nr:AraC family transcriptional regulator [Paenibacillus xerothermodurans]PZE22011.1 AraC family transcriptional regulator [Paenibacillus xerothermodurans]